MEVNPHEAPTATYARSSEPSLGSMLRFAFISAGNGVVCFFVWCLLDVLIVKLPAIRVRNFDWIVLLLPVGAWIGSIVTLHGDTLAIRIVLSIAAALLATILTTTLIFTFANSFHVAIGGKL